jgi:hypothetical protein
MVTWRGPEGDDPRLQQHKDAKVPSSRVSSAFEYPATPLHEPSSGALLVLRIG